MTHFIPTGVQQNFRDLTTAFTWLMFIYYEYRRLPKLFKQNQ